MEADSQTESLSDSDTRLSYMFKLHNLQSLYLADLGLTRYSANGQPSLTGRKFNGPTAPESPGSDELTSHVPMTNPTPFAIALCSRPSQRGELFCALERKSAVLHSQCDVLYLHPDTRWRLKIQVRIEHCEIEMYTIRIYHDETTEKARHDPRDTLHNAVKEPF